MAVGGVNYASPVTVNGFLCRNCADVDYAAKRIDPSHPRSGPDNVNAAQDPTQPASVKQRLAEAKEKAAALSDAGATYARRGHAAGSAGAGLVLNANA